MPTTASIHIAQGYEWCRKTTQSVGNAITVFCRKWTAVHTQQQELLLIWRLHAHVSLPSMQKTVMGRFFGAFGAGMQTS